MDRMEPRELLSAYLDGEVTPAERAEAERLLESSPELRGELDDFARLSDLIRGMPRETAPADLAPAIRKQASQQSLLRPEPAVAPRSLRREIVSALIGMAVTAAGMLLMLQTAERHQGQWAQTRNAPAEALTVGRDELAAAHSVGLDMGAAQSMEAAPVVSRSQPVQFQADAPSTDIATGGAAPAPAAPSPAKSGVQKTAVERAEPEMAKAKNLLPNGSAAGFAGSLGAMDAFADANMNRNGMNWSAVRIGDVVPYLERSGNGVAVVELTVLDINDAANQMEVLLERYHLPVLQDGDTASDKQRSVEQKSDARRGKKTPAADASELITVYVEGPSSDLTQFLNDMDDQQVFLTAQLQPPVDLPTLDDNEKLAEMADRDTFEANLTEKEAEQIVMKQEAAEATNQYVANRFLNAQNLAAAGDNAGNLAEKPGSTSQLRRMTGASQTARGMANADRKQTSPQAKKDFDAEGPADALAAVHTPGPATNYYRQRSAVAIQNTVNPSLGLLKSNSLSAGKTANSVAEKAASNLSEEGQREALKRAKESEQDAAAESLADEPVPTVRLLFVLQQAAPAGPPRE